MPAEQAGGEAQGRQDGVSPQRLATGSSAQLLEPAAAAPLASAPLGCGCARALTHHFCSASAWPADRQQPSLRCQPECSLSRPPAAPAGLQSAHHDSRVCPPPHAQVVGLRAGPQGSSMPQPATRSRVKRAGRGAVLVTVGTTKFDALVRAVDDPAVAEALAAHGYTELIIQARASRIK